MASGRKITIEFLGNNSDLDKAMDQSASRSSKFGDALKKAGKVAALGLAAGAVIAGKALFDMTKAAIEDEAAQKKLANTLKNATGATDAQVASTEEWISAQGVALGVTDDELRPALSKLAIATGDVGKAQELAALAMDASAGSGKSLEQTAKALADAEQGRLGGLGKLGIATKDAAGNALSLDEIHANMAKTFEGAAASSADTLDGKMKRLKIALAEAGEEIGAKLIPVVTTMAEWFLNKGLPAVQQFGGWFQDNLLPIFQKVGEVFGSVLGGMNGGTSSNLTAIKDTFASVVSIITSLWNTFGATLTEYIQTALTNAKQIIGGLLQVISGIFKTFAALLKGDWAGVWEGIKQILSGAMNVIKGVLNQALNVISTLWKVAWTGIKGILGGVWDGIKTLIDNGIGKVMDAIRAIPGKIKDVGGAMKDAGASIIGKLLDGLKSVGGFAGDFAANVWGAIKGLINDAIGKINNALPNSIGKGPLEIDLPDSPIPYLAKGTNFHRGGLAVVGEEGPELVNLPRGSRVTPNKQSMGAMSALGGGSSAPTIVQLVVGSRVLEQILIEHTRETGRPLQVRTLGPA